MVQRILVIVFWSVSFCLSSCAVYKIDIQQGNIVTQKMLDKLEFGMSVRKVHFIMGTPLIEDVFHQQRWDYLYSFEEGGGKRQQRRVSLFFKNDHLINVMGDVKIGKQNEPANTPIHEEFDQEPIL